MGKKNQRHNRPRNPVKKSDPKSESTDRGADWHCPACNSVCWGSRDKCFKCNEPKPNLITTKSGNKSDKKYSEDFSKPIAKAPWQNWTGKTPMTLLSEWCQKNNHSKPSYSPVKSSETNTFRYRVSVTDKKAKQGEGTQTIYQHEAQEDSTFARHCAAVQMLHTLNPTLPLYRVMAPEFRQVWETCGVRHAEKEAMEEKRQISQQKRAQRQERQAAAERKLEQLPLLLMSEDAQKAVLLVVNQALKNEKDDSSNTDDQMDGTAVRLATQKLCRLGFSENDVEDAMEAIPSDTAEQDLYDVALDWLCLNLPADQLPSKLQSRGQLEVVQTGPARPVQPTADPHATVVVQSNDPLVARLVFAGHTESASVSALGLHQGDYCHALQHLCGSASSSTVDPDTVADECLALSAILADKFTCFGSMCGDSASASPSDSTAVVPDNSALIRCRLPSFQSTEAVLEVFIQHDCGYPDAPPAFAVVSLAPRLTEEQHRYIHQVTKDAVEHARDQLLGAPFIFSLCSFVQSQLEEFSPSKASSVVSKASENVGVVKQPSKEQKLVAELDDSKMQALLSKLEQTSDAASKSKHNHVFKPLTGEKLRQQNEQLAADFSTLQSTAGYRKMQSGRQQLPAWKQRDAILKAIAGSRSIVISGETGCGKSTQVPQYILDEALVGKSGADCSILCAQPRRLAAIGVAERVASERGEACGQTVGYAIRLERKACASTRLLYCTTGVLLRRLTRDPNLLGVSHVIVDEVHERTADGDFLLVILRRLQRTVRKDLRVILMSATVDARLFASYFENAPTFHIPGFMFPVKEHYIEDVLQHCVKPKASNRPRNAADTAALQQLAVDLPKYSAGTHQTMLHLGYRPAVTTTTDTESNEQTNSTKQSGASWPNQLQVDTAEQVIRAIADGTFLKENPSDDGAVLVFLPGVAAIRELSERLSNDRNVYALPLHAAMSAAEQKRAFEPAPHGKTKVLLSTNIAETSLTLNDVVYVIDGGRENEMQYDAVRRTSALVETWVAQASAQQRRGRAGRVRAGHCVRLYSQQHFRHFPSQPTPEIARIPLHQLCLQILGLQLGSPISFLNEALQPPPADAVQSATQTLREIGAIEEKKDVITPLGMALAALPVDVHMGKLLLFGTMLRCVRPALTLAATLSCRTPFVAPLDKRDEADRARKSFGGKKQNSDHLILINAYNAYDVLSGRGAQRKFCEQNFMAHTAMRQIQGVRQQLEALLFESGFVARARGQSRAAALDACDTNASSERILRAVLTAGLWPNCVHAAMPDGKYKQVVAGAVAVDAESREIRYYTRERERVFMHPTSVNFHATSFGACPYVVFYELVRTSKPYVRDSSALTGYAMLLFGGSIGVDASKGLLSIDNWAKFRAAPRVAVLARLIRRAVSRLLLLKTEYPS